MLLVIVAVCAAVWILPAPIIADSGSASLSVGDWWTLHGTVRRTATGTGTDRGTWARDLDQNMKFSVSSIDGNKIVISYEISGSWTSTATESWITPNGGATRKGTISDSVDITLDLSNLKVTAVSEKDYDSWVGHPTSFLVNTKALEVGSTMLLPWWDESNKLVDTPWTVNELTSVKVKGLDVSAWSLSYTGKSTGFWRVGETYSTGQETETYQFDNTHGVCLGGVESGSYSFTRSGGGWQETYSRTAETQDTNLVFSVAVTFGVEQTAASMTLDGTTYAGSELPKTFMLDPGSTHTLQVQETIEGDSGVRYVFVEWSDGSRDTSRTITVTEPTSYTAKFKTQYELTVVSHIGDPQGGGWYDSGSEATFSVTSPQTDPGFFGSLGGKRVFLRWSGDISADSATASITMDAPKTVRAEWKVDNSQPYMILGGIAVVIVVAILAFVLMRRRGRPVSAPPPVRPAPPVAVPELAPAPPPTPAAPAQPPPAPEGAKYCIHCGAAIPSVVLFCTKCGKKQ